jgi:hypothetical protein
MAADAGETQLGLKKLIPGGVRLDRQGGRRQGRRQGPGG